MAKTVKKAAKKAPAKKPHAKAKAKVAAKPTAKPHAKVLSHAGFMWKMLERKEHDRKAQQEQHKSKFNMHKFEKQTPTATEGAHRFAGPRRKAV